MSKISKEEMDAAVAQAFQSLDNDRSSYDDSPKRTFSDRDRRLAEAMKEKHESNLRLVRGLGKGVTGTLDFLSYPLNAIAGNGWQSAGLTEGLNEYFGDIGDDDLGDNAAEVLGSLATGAGARRLITKAAPYIPYGKEIAQTIGEYTPKIVKKGADFLANSVFNKSVKPTDVASGVAGIKGAEAVANALEDSDIDPYLKAAATIAGGLGSSYATSSVPALARTAKNKAVQNIVDPSKVELLKKMDMPLELSRVLNDDFPFSESIRNVSQAGADLPFATKAHKNRGATIEKAKEYLHIPKNYEADADAASKVYRDVFQKERKALSDQLRPLKEEAGIARIENPDFIEYQKSVDKHKSNNSKIVKSTIEESFIPYDKASAREQLKRVTLVGEKGRDLLGDLLDKNLPEGEAIDIVYKKVAPKKSANDLSFEEFEEAYSHASKRNPNHPEHKSFEERKKFIEQHNTHEIPPATIMKYGEERVIPSNTRSVLKDLTNEDLNPVARHLKQVIESSPDKDINIKTIRNAISRLNKLKTSSVMSETQKEGIWKVRKAATQDLQDALDSIDPKAGKAYGEFRESYKKYNTEHPTKHTRDKFENKNLEEGSGYEAGVIKQDLKSEGTGYALRNLNPHFTSDEAKAALPHLWAILGKSDPSKGIDIMKIRKAYSTIDKSKKHVINDLVKKAYGKDINIDDVFKVLDELPKVTKYQNTSRTANTSYIHDLNSEFGELIANAGNKKFWKELPKFVTKKAPGFFINFANNSEWVIESLVKLNKVNNPSQGINLLKGMSKEGVANPAVINHMIKTIQDHYNKKDRKKDIDD